MDYFLDAGGHGYSFVFSVNIWGAAWWGKLRRSRLHLFEWITIAWNILFCYLIRSSSLEYSYSKFGLLNNFPKKKTNKCFQWKENLFTYTSLWYCKLKHEFLTSHIMVWARILGVHAGFMPILFNIWVLICNEV